MEVTAPRVECGVPARSGSRSGVLLSSAAADRVTVASVRRRRASSAGELSRKDDDAYFRKSSFSVGARLPILSESCPNQRARRDCLIVVRAEKGENGTEETPEVANLGQPTTTEETPEIANFGQPIVVTKSALLTSLDFWVQVAIFVFAAGFVDAGFSGDWSRIGVLTKQTEEELQMAALGVVPLAFTLIWSISQRRNNL